MSVGAVNKQTGDRIPTAGMPAIDDALDLTSVNPVQNAIVTAALADKQDKSDNALQTTDKTIVGGINEHEGDIDSLKSGLINVADDVKLNTQDLTTPSRTKNLLNYDEWKKVNVIGGSGVFENNGITLTATTNDCYTGHNNTDFPINARIPISEGETITLSWQANNDLSGMQYIFPNGSVSGAVSKNNANGKSLSYTAGPGVTYVTFRFGVGNVGNSIEYSNIQIEKGNTATTFAPYIPSVETRLDAVESGLNNKVRALVDSQLTACKIISFVHYTDDNVYNVWIGHNATVSELTKIVSVYLCVVNSDPTQFRHEVELTGISNNVFTYAVKGGWSGGANGVNVICMVIGI